jgi:hypothetical protein
MVFLSKSTIGKKNEITQEYKSTPNGLRRELLEKRMIVSSDLDSGGRIQKLQWLGKMKEEEEEN